MPILMSVKQLEEGMRLASNVVKNSNVMLAHGRRLTQPDIESLVRRFPDIRVQIGNPVLDETIDFQDDRADQETSRKVRGQISTVAKKVSSSIRAGMDLKAENIAGIQETIERVIEFFQKNPVTMAFVEQATSGEGYLQEHTSNVFYLSLVIGNTIRNYIKTERERLSAARTVSNAMDITPLATAALFQDIGMVPLKHLSMKREPLTEAEVQLIKQHPIVGAEMLPDCISGVTRLAIRHHHENLDGSGYPEELTGNKVNIFARILRVADAYSAATADKVYRQAKSPIRVLHEMLYGDYARFYDPVILKVFASIMRPLPIGAKLQLNTGQAGVIVRHDRQDPFLPEIIIAFDESGEPLPREQLGKPFPLAQRDDIQALAFGEEDLTFLGDRPDPASDPSPGHKAACGRYGEMFDLMYP